MAASGDSPTRSFVYGDLQIVDPSSDLSFEDGSTSRVSTTSGKNSRASHPSLKYPVFFRTSKEMERTDHMISNVRGRSVHPSTSSERKIAKIGKTVGATASANSETSLQRFRSIIIKRPKNKSLHRSTDPQNSAEPRLKRRIGPWVRTRKSLRKRLKYYSFSNDSNEIDDDSLDCNFSNSASTKPISFEVSLTKHQLDDCSFRIDSSDPSNESISFIVPGGAYDNRLILTTMFDENEYDDSFHQERKAMEPLLKSKEIKQLANLHLEDRNPTSCLQLINVATSTWAIDNTRQRDQTSPTHWSVEPSDMDIEVSNAIVANQCFSVLEDTPVDSDDYSSSTSRKSDEKPLLKKSFFALCGCFLRNYEWHRRSRHPHRRRAPGADQTYRVQSTTSDDNSHNGEVVDQDGSFPRIPIKEKSSFLDEESLQRELHKLDVLANEVYRNSPELLTMPVNSQLSAIPEVDEDLTQKSSSLSAHSSIDKSQHFQIEGKNYSSLGAMLDNDRASIGTEEPNLLSTLDNRSQNSKTPFQERRKIKVESTGARTASESIKNGFNDPVNREKGKGDNSFPFKGEEITVTSICDDGSTSGISDLTDDFLQIPMTPPWYKKAMEMFNDMATEEDGSGAGVVEESRDDLDDLNHIVTLQIDSV